MAAKPKSSSKTSKITPERLLDAIAPRIADGRLHSVNLATAAKLANVTLAEVEACFPERQALLVALHQRYVKQVLDRVVEESGRHPAGLPRLRMSITGFLDACLEQRNVRQQLLEMEARHLALARAAAARRNSFRVMLSLELKSCGVKHPDDMASLMRSMVEETSRMEGEAGKAKPAARALLWSFLESQVPR